MNEKYEKPELIVYEDLADVTTGFMSSPPG